MNNEFYIGWMPNAPASFAKQIKKVILALICIVVATGILLAMSQKKFSTANFEFGTLTQLKGIYFNQPVPCIKVTNGRDMLGNLSFITIPLVGFGKTGAAGIIEGLEKEKKTFLNQKEIVLKGTLLYSDGKLLAQIDINDKPLISIGNKADSSLLPQEKALGNMTIKGEIIDPKCFFGVMKPGEGKPHRDCAARCIAGGMPPVLRVVNEEGMANYYLLVDANGEKLNDAIKDFVAEPVQLYAQAVKYDDWIVLYVNPATGIRHYSYLQEKFGESVQYCIKDCR